VKHLGRGRGKNRGEETKFITRERRGVDQTRNGHAYRKAHFSSRGKHYLKSKREGAGQRSKNEG